MKTKEIIFFICLALQLYDTIADPVFIWDCLKRKEEWIQERSRQNRKDSMALKIEPVLVPATPMATPDQASPVSPSIPSTPGSPSRVGTMDSVMPSEMSMGGIPIRRPSIAARKFSVPKINVNNLFQRKNSESDSQFRRPSITSITSVNSISPTSQRRPVTTISKYNDEYKYDRIDVLCDELDLYLIPDELKRFSNRDEHHITERLEYLEQCKLFIDIIRRYNSPNDIFLMVENKELTLMAGGKLISEKLAGFLVKFGKHPEHDGGTYEGNAKHIIPYNSMYYIPNVETDGYKLFTEYHIDVEKMFLNYKAFSRDNRDKRHPYNDYVKKSDTLTFFRHTGADFYDRNFLDKIKKDKLTISNQDFQYSLGKIY